ncbi:MAG: ATP-binding protein [Gammaproteobacteria bacterium]|nr:ATP-binding protein [Gammaproteobacteria bacterium]MDP2347456.1 ATP-binding protein [Gammaproteobacteria bacterium]
MLRRAPPISLALLILAGSMIMLSGGALNAQDVSEWLRLTSDYYNQQRIEQQRELIFFALPVWAMVLNLVAAVILLVVWRRQRSVAQFYWLIGISLTGNGYFLHSLSGGLIDSVVTDSLTAAWLYFLSRILYNYPTPALQRVLGALPILTLILYGTTSMLDMPRLHGAVTGSYCLFLLVMSSQQIGLRLQQPLTPKLSLVFGVWFISVLGVVDSMIVMANFSLPAHPDLLIQLVPIGQIVGVFAALYFLVARHAQNQQQLEALNASLDQRVQAAEAELEDRYRMLTRDALDAAAIRERKTIYQSIHEDLSDKLLQLIYAARTPETADLARSALAELRDSRKLHPEQERPLVDILADALSEIQTRCDQTGLTLHWQVDERTHACRLSARQESALTRTLRESLSNLLKHAQASTVTIEFALAPVQSGSMILEYSVTDNGKGISADHRPGRGLVNMRNRMKELGGSVNIAAAPQENGTSQCGTRLTFTLPLMGEDA